MVNIFFNCFVQFNTEEKILGKIPLSSEQVTQCFPLLLALLKGPDNPFDHLHAFAIEFLGNITLSSEQTIQYLYLLINRLKDPGYIWTNNAITKALNKIIVTPEQRYQALPLMVNTDHYDYTFIPILQY